jgi:toxin ParE1/3/4
LPYQILWSDSALERIAEILDFIAEENPATAQRAVEDLRGGVRRLADLPRLGRPLSDEMDPNLRRLVLGDYVILYRIHEASQTITIASVRHFRQRSLAGEEV